MCMCVLLTRVFMQAHRFCFSVTIVNIVPYIFFLIAAVYSLSAVVLLPFVLLQWIVELLFQGLAFVHMGAPAPGNNDAN